MATIGTFTQQENGFQGVITTLTVKAKVNIVPADKSSEKAPDYRCFAGNAEIGAAWAQQSKEGKKYLSVKLDDPSFPAAITARLIEGDQKHTLIWTR